jgi:hypothetical protein
MRVFRPRPSAHGQYAGSIEVERQRNIRSQKGWAWYVFCRQRSVRRLDVLPVHAVHKAACEEFDMTSAIRCLSATALLLLTSGVAQATSITATYAGNVGAQVAAYPTAGSPAAGTLSISGIPVGATILSASLLTDNYFSNPVINATFAGNVLGAGTTFATDGGAGNLAAYSWDVTSLVTGDGNYNASYTGATNTYGMELIVVYSAASLPSGRVQVITGAIDVCGVSPCVDSLSFTGFAAGPGTLWIHTEADNALGQSGETIGFNGTTVGGPIDANLGNFASLFRLPVSVLAGANSVQIDASIGRDQFAWDTAVLYETGGAVAAVPEPATLVLLGSGLLTAGLRRSKRAKR